jgi:hypothetical protein
VSACPAPPPPIIDSAKLLAYAVVDSNVEFTDRISLFVDGAKLGKVPKLAITANYVIPGDILLEFCDSEWNTLGVTAHKSIDEAKAQAERGYRGISSKWFPSPYSETQVSEYIRESYGLDPTTEWWKTICSFCGEDTLEVRAFASQHAVICEKCLVAFHEEIAKPRDA